MSLEIQVSDSWTSGATFRPCHPEVPDAVCQRPWGQGLNRQWCLHGSKTGSQVCRSRPVLTVLQKCEEFLEAGVVTGWNLVMFWAHYGWHGCSGWRSREPKILKICLRRLFAERQITAKGCGSLMTVSNGGLGLQSHMMACPVVVVQEQGSEDWRTQGFFRDMGRPGCARVTTRDVVEQSAWQLEGSSS